MSPGAGSKKRLGLGVGAVAGGGLLGCGCRDAKAVAVAVAASSSASPYSATTATETASTATTATWRRTRTTPHPSSASGSTGTLTVPSASSSSFLWEDADAETGEEVNCKRESPAATTSFSGLLRQLNELEQSFVSWGRKSASKDHLSSPLLARQAKQRPVHSAGDSKEGHGNFSPPPPPPAPSSQFQTTQQHRTAKNMDEADRQAEEVRCKQPPPPPPPSFQFQTAQQQRRTKSMHKADRQAEEVHSKQPPPPPLPLPPEQPKVKSTDDKVGKKEDASILPTPQAPNHRKARSLDGGAGPVRLDGTVAVVKQSDDPLSDFRRSMVNMIVENRIVTGDELRELLRHFLALNAPHHHDAILRAFTEIWDEAFSAKAAPRREPAAAAVARTKTPPRPRPKAPTPPRRRDAPPPRAWR